MVTQDIIYKDRKEAGQYLARHLEKYKDDPLVIVMGVPRGGVEVAYEVALYLNAPLCIVIAKKLAVPSNKEYGFGALAEDGSMYIPPEAKRLLGEKMLNQVVATQKAEIQRRIDLYREGHPIPNLKDRKVIIVDDGVATGVTLVPLVMLCHKKEAGRVILAAPVASPRYDWHLDEADEVVFLQQPPSFRAVGQFYQQFSDMEDEQVLAFLRRNKCSLKPLSY